MPNYRRELIRRRIFEILLSKQSSYRRRQILLWLYFRSSDLATRVCARAFDRRSAGWLPAGMPAC